MSQTEVYGNYQGVIEGIGWDYWKNKTGLSQPNTDANSGRVVRSSSGVAQNVWLRSSRNSPYVWHLSTNGSIVYSGSSSALGVLPACFIPGKESVTVTFDTRGGVPVPEPQSVVLGEKAKRPEVDPEKENDPFLDWYLLGQVPNTIGEIPVMFRMNGGTPQEPTQYVTTGEKATEPTTAPTLDGYSFLGWYEAGDIPEGWNGIDII